MKRSKKACLILMPTLITLHGCGEEPVQTAVFEDINQCAQYYNQQYCVEQHAQAEYYHNQMAPQYASRYDCEADFGSNGCQQHAGNDSFIPFMAGYMMSSPGYTNSSQITTQPLYRSLDDRRTLRTASNMAVGFPGKHYNVYPSTARPYIAGKVTRGGFGYQAAARSSSSSYGG